MTTAYLGSLHDSPLWQAISDECDRAEQKFGRQLDATDLEWLAILTEELGEAAMEVTKNCVRPLTPSEGYVERLRAEIVQVAAVAVRWLDAIREESAVTVMKDRPLRQDGGHDKHARWHEAEAVAAYRKDLAEKVRELPTMDVGVRLGPPPDYPIIGERKRRRTALRFRTAVLALIEEEPK